MKKGVVKALAFASIALGGLTLVSTLSNPSLDPLILTRDLGLSITALSLGFAAPILHRKFAESQEEV